jgi:hypothetical protein
MSLSPVAAFALIPSPASQGEGSQPQSPSPWGKGLKPCGIQEKGEGAKVTCSRDNLRSIVVIYNSFTLKCGGEKLL